MAAVEQFYEYEERTLLLPDAAARAIVASVPHALALSPTDRREQWRVKASGHVGTISLPGLQILIKPKVRMASVLYLMDAGMPASAWGSGTFAYAHQSDLLAAFAGFFARALNRATSRGLLRSYRPASDRLVALRGRIDFPEQLRRPATPIPIACSYDDFTADIDENRFLLGGVERLLRALRLDPVTRSSLIHLRARFEDVRPVLPSLTQLAAIQFNRLNEHYESALKLVSFIVQNLSLHDRSGTHDASSFLVDMSKLYEDWVTRKLREALRGRLDVKAQTGRHLDRKGRVSIRPDLEFHRGGQVRYVGDVKYKLSKDGLARTADYYQLLAYSTALDVPEGVLIYAQAEGAPPDEEVTVRHTDKRLVTYRLDLSGPLDQVEGSAADLAVWITNRSAGADDSLRVPDAPELLRLGAGS